MQSYDSLHDRNFQLIRFIVATYRYRSDIRQYVHARASVFEISEPAVPW